MIMTSAAREFGVWISALAAAAALALLAHPARAGASAIPAAPGGANGAIDAISCASAGDCTAVGHLAPPNRKVLFTITERNGVWGTARAVSGLAGLLGNKPSGARFSAVSCPSADDCVAVGSYSPSASLTRAFVVSERNGVWGKMKRVTGLAALNVDNFISVDTVSCTSAGNCSAGGSYVLGGVGHFVIREAFLVNKKHGAWSNAQKVRGLARLNTGDDVGDRPDARFSQISCATAGNCTAVGSYAGPKGTEPFAATEKDGTWGKARAFPSIIVINRGFFAELSSVWCTPDDTCTAVGSYSQTETDGGYFAVSQKKGVWRASTGAPGLAPGAIGSLTCVSAGNCTAGGYGLTDLDTLANQPFIDTERNGSWSFQRLPGVAELSAGSMQARLAAVICRSAGNCSAAGTYGASTGEEVYISTEQNGAWNTAVGLPGLAALNTGGLASPPVLSCGAPGDCGLGGTYRVGHLSKPYLASQRNGIWGKAKEVRGIETLPPPVS